jgi:hypothetical protein
MRKPLRARLLRNTHHPGYNATHIHSGHCTESTSVQFTDTGRMRTTVRGYAICIIAHTGDGICKRSGRRKGHRGLRRRMIAWALTMAIRLLRVVTVVGEKGVTIGSSRAWHRALIIGRGFIRSVRGRNWSFRSPRGRRIGLNTMWSIISSFGATEDT